MPVKVMEAKAVPINDAAEYVATLKSRDSAVIMPQVEGQITQIFVHSGDQVQAGRRVDGDRSAEAAGHGQEPGERAGGATGESELGETAI